LGEVVAVGLGDEVAESEARRAAASQAGASTAVVPVDLHIRLEAERILSAAAVNNGLPVLRSVVVANRSSEAISGLTISLRANPPVLDDLTFHLDSLPAGDVHESVPVMPANLEQLSRQNESVAVVITAEVRKDGVLLASNHAALDATAWDEWPGERAIPELLSAFCLPKR